MDHETYMRQALQLADTARMADEVPVGAIIMRETLMLGEGYNQNIGSEDPTAHAEIMALRASCNYLQNYRLTGDTTLYVTLEPCPMCFYALVHARVKRIVYGADDPKTGFTRFFHEDHLDAFNHRIEIISGVLQEECSQQIRDFFREKRERGKRKWMKEANRED